MEAPKADVAATAKVGAGSKDVKTEKEAESSKAKAEESTDTADQKIAVTGKYGTYKTSGNIDKDMKESKRKDATKISKLDDAWTVLKLAMKSSSDKQYSWLAALASASLASTVLAKMIASAQAAIQRAIHSRSMPAFQGALLRHLMLASATRAFKELATFFQGRLTQVWHVGVTKALHERYFGSQAFFHLGRAGLSDADQRIAVDAEETLSTASNLVKHFATIVVLAPYFTFSIYREMGALSAVAPWLFIVVMRKLTNLIPLDWRRLIGTMEFTFGQYRSQHQRLVQHGEAVAALQGAELEGGKLRKFLLETERAQRFFWDALTTYIISQQAAFTWGAKAFAPIVVLWPLLQGRENAVDMMAKATYHVSLFGEAMQSSGMVAAALQDLQRIGGNSARVTQLLAAFDKVDSFEAETNMTMQASKDVIEFTGVEVVTPTGNTLVEDLNFKITRGSNLMITGHNGAGKSSIFRCLGGLWKIPKGTITKPGSGSGLHGEVFYLPQKPYNLVGTLVEQVTYPQYNAKLEKSELKKLLDLVDLGYLSEREGEVDWERVLSLGEQQRLAMVRVFFHGPAFAVLDECTSGVSTEMEVRFYSSCIERKITCITISHRPALQRFHDRILSLDGKKKYHIEKVKVSGQAEVRKAAITGSAQLNDTSAPSVRVRSAATQLKEMAAIMRIAIPDSIGLKLFKSVVASASKVAVWNFYGSMMAGMYSRLLTRDVAGFRRNAAGLVVWVFGASAVIAFNRHNQCHLGTDLRMKISTNLLEQYLQKDAFLRLKNALGGQGAPRVMDPEARLSQDIRDWAVTASACLTTLPTLISEGAWFAFSLSKVAGTRTSMMAYAYAAVAVLVVRYVMPSTTKIAQQERALDAKYRSEHASVLASAESIAFFGGGIFEREVVERRFRDKMDLKHSTLTQTTEYKFVKGFLLEQVPEHAAALMQASMMFNATLEGAALSAAQQRIIIGVQRLFESLDQIMEYFDTLARLSGSTARLHELLEALNALGPVGEGAQPSDDIWFNGVDIVTPSGTCLVKGLEVKVPAGKSLMVTGPNGCGKSSLFRALGGMWTMPGALYRPARRLDVFLVPQKPFLTSPGTLADQVTYPEKVELTDELKTQLRGHLEAVGLGDLLDREGWDAQAKDNVLSLGEQQRLGVARLFYHKPAFAVLDECTSAVSADAEGLIYDLAHKLGITTITLSQRLALDKYHKQELQLGLPDAKWILKDIVA